MFMHVEMHVFTCIGENVPRSKAVVYPVNITVFS